MTIIAADTGPLNYLLQIEEVAFLPKLFREVLIPSSVRAELLHPNAPAAVRSWMAAPPAWLRVQNPAQRLSGSEIGVAELDAISLAHEVKAWLLIDDKEARSFAQ